MSAAAARWVNSDDSQARGVVRAWQDSPERVFDWKLAPRLVAGYESDLEELPPVPWDFDWRPLTGKGGGWVSPVVADAVMGFTLGIRSSALLICDKTPRLIRPFHKRRQARGADRKEKFARPIVAVVACRLPT